MKAFSISDWSLIKTISKRGNSQDDVLAQLLSEIASTQTQLSKELIVIDLQIDNNSVGNFWEGTFIYTTIDSGITFH